MQFWADLSGIELSDKDENEVVWLQALPLNKYRHPIHGIIDITPERAKRFAENVKKKVRGIDLDIDYDHKLQRRDAAGWVVDAEAKLNEPEPRKNGLWIAVQFTQEAKQKLKDKAYRYFSSEFKNSWTDPATNETFNDVLFGGALTNRPFLKDILPINLSEIDPENENLKGSSMDELKKELGLPDDATDEQVLEAVKANKAAAEAPKVAETNNEPPKTEETQTETKTELDEQLKQLAEANPVVAVLLAEREENNKRIAALEADTRKSTIAVKLSELTAGEGLALKPAAVEAVKQFAERDDVSVELADEMFKVLETISKEGVVELGERGATSERQTDAQKALEAATSKVMTDKNVDYATALSEVVATNPSLYENYERELLEA